MSKMMVDDLLQVDSTLKTVLILFFTVTFLHCRAGG